VTLKTTPSELSITLLLTLINIDLHATAEFLVSLISTIWLGSGHTDTWRKTS